MNDGSFDEEIYIENYEEGPFLILEAKPDIDDFPLFLKAHDFQLIDLGSNDHHDWYSFFAWERWNDSSSKEYIVEIINFTMHTLVRVYCKGTSSYVKCVKDMSEIYYNLVFTKSERDRIEDEIERNSIKDEEE